MKNNEELKGLLYRKIVSENSMEKYAKGVKVHSDVCEAIKKLLKNENESDFEKARLEIELNKNEWECRTFSANYKSTRQEYQHRLIPSIEKIASKKEQKSIQFVDHYKKAQELADSEIFGKTSKLSANIEHPYIIDDIKKNISILDDYIFSIKNELEKVPVSEYVRAKLNKELYDTKIHVQTLKKRLANREDYYYNQFLPIYTVELAEAKEKLQSYYERGLEMVAQDLDVQLAFVLKLYDEHKDTEERIWLYYTALKTRINGIMDEIKKNPVQFEKVIHLSNPI